MRELENVLMKGVALCPGNTLIPDLLPEHILAAEVKGSENAFGKPIEEWSLEEMEQVHVRRVLESTDWHRGQAGEVLRVSRPRLRRMMRQYGITPPAGMDDDENSANLE